MTATATAAVDQEFEQLENKFGARLGVYALDTGTGRAVTYRADERFAYASTHKVLAVASVLQQNSEEELDHVLHYTSTDLVTHSPITQQHVDTGMTVRELCDAAIRYSDNTAGNLLFRELGGPSGLSAELRKFGDEVTQVDRIETELNEATPGDLRDTSTPRALADDLKKFAVGNILAPGKRALLTDWLQGNTTGASLIRAGVPAGWKVGDKSGTGGYGTRNDIAIVWPPTGAPIVLTILSSRSAQDATYNDALVAEATKVTLSAMAKTPDSRYREPG